MGEYRFEWSSGAGLSRRPFLMYPDPSFWIPLEDCERIREELSRCVTRGEGVGLLTGVSGTGKSLICQSLYEEFLDDGRNSDVAQVVLLQPGRMSRSSEFDAALLSGMGVELPTQSISGIFRVILDQYLVTLDRAILVIVDPAERLSLRVWEEIQSLAGFSYSGRTPLRWVLSGSQSLEEVLSHPRLASLNQRIAVRANLRNWNLSETQRYIEDQLRAAKGDPRHIFTESNERQIHRLTDGLPRMVNLLCDRILWHSLSENVAGPFEEWQIQAVWDEIEGIASASLTRPNTKITSNREMTSSFFAVRSPELGAAEFVANPPTTPTVRTSNPSPSSMSVDDPVLSFGALEDDDIQNDQLSQPITESNDTDDRSTSQRANTTISVSFSELDPQDETATSIAADQLVVSKSLEPLESLESTVVESFVERESEESRREMGPRRNTRQFHAVEQFHSRAIFSQLRRRPS